jgi:signal transduction histidine kinase
MATAGMSDSAVNIGVVANSDREVMVSVADRGPGIAPDQIEYIFRPFHSTKESGLAIGLTLSRAIIEAHDGQHSAIANPGGGSVFRFTLLAANEGTGRVPQYSLLMTTRPCWIR